MANVSHMTNDAESTAKKIASNVADAASDLAGKAGQQFDRALGSAEATMRSVAEQGRDASERVQVVAGNLKGAVQKSVQEQPMTTLAVAAAAGFVLGALWKS